MSVRRRASATVDVEPAADVVRRNARPLRESADFDALIDAVGDSSYVLLGEASHGTSEFYQWRATLTARLIQERDFSFVAVEGDWTDCYEINQYVKGNGPDDALEVLDAFERWPTWMWANWEIVEFVEWLREYNQNRSEGEQVGFYGMDVYSLFESMAEIVDYLERTDPELAAQARDAFNCFEPYGEDAREYARSTRIVPETCEEEVVELLTELRDRQPDSGQSRDDRFSVEQNALVAKNAEAYYRSMGRGDDESWNVRDRHMVETLDRLVDHHGTDSKAVVWAHNTHVGDARATDMVDRGKVNVGQLVREAHGADDVTIVGFGTHHGDVIAGSEWGAQMQAMDVPPGRDGSIEDVFHRAEEDDALLVFDDLDNADADELGTERGHRAIGVVYNPDRELGNYVPTSLTERYDAYVHVDESDALHPLHIDPGEMTEPDAYPWGV